MESKSKKFRESLRSKKYNGKSYSYELNKQYREKRLVEAAKLLEISSKEIRKRKKKKGIEHSIDEK